MSSFRINSELKRRPCRNKEVEYVSDYELFTFLPKIFRLMNDSPRKEV